MTKVRREGFVFLTWMGDHAPRHVHVYRDGALVVRWDLDTSTRLRRPAVKIRSVQRNNRKHAFEVATWRHHLLFPYAKADPAPTTADPLVDLSIDEELGREGFTYRLASGREGSVHVEQVLDYNEDPGYLRDLLLYRLTIEAQERVDASPLSTREVIRRLQTSPAQFYRLLDPTNYRKSVDKVLLLLSVLGCDVDLVVRERSTPPSRGHGRVLQRAGSADG